MIADWFNDSSIAERIAHLRQSVPPSVRLIAVTKTVPVALMKEAYAAGIRDFGESRMQEAIAKQAAFSDCQDIVWHWIGHLQRNKAKQAAMRFHWLHSVDSLPLAQHLNTLAAHLNNPPHICLQVKLRSDPSKFGWSPDALLAQLGDLKALDGLRINGLMTLLPLNLTPEEQLAVFQETQQLAETIRQHPHTPLPLTELSMGMSNDYPLALQAGATMVRLGTIIFGKRQ
ncbi:MAG: YggS family pyridoxal phosphate-dependent enzyme [Thermosynechococcaceae cyanobacterium]